MCGECPNNNNKKIWWSKSPMKESGNHHSLVSYNCIIFNSYEGPSNHRLKANKLFLIV